MCATVRRMTSSSGTAQHADVRPSILGDAPRLLLSLGPVVVVAIVLSAVFPGSFRFLGRYWGVGVVAGIELLAVGLVFWVSATITLVRAYRTDTLATGGAFSLCRHPIYAWWVFLVLPGVGLLTNSYLFLVAAIIVGLLLRPTMAKEETYMAARYRDGYDDYAKTVRALIPLPRLLPLTFRRYAGFGAMVVAVGAFMAAIFFIVGLPVLSGLGATHAERNAEIAGDRYIASPRQGYTQAYSYDAPPDEIWPWLIQVGYRRAGWYNVDAINRLAVSDYFIEGKHSAWRIHPELQSIGIGDHIELVPGMAMVVTDMEPNRLFVLVGDPTDPHAETNAAWSYVLSPSEDGGTRMVVRFAAAFPGGLGSALLNGFVNVVGGAMIQQPAMLYGIERRADRPR